MDIFTEHIIKKEKTIADTLISIGLAIITFIVAFIVLTSIPSIGPLIAAGVGYAGYMMITARNLEYEYSFTNGELDVDKIIARRKRKRLLSIRCNEFDILAPVNEEEYNKEFTNINIQKTINASSSIKSENAYFAVFILNGERTKLIFEPTQKMMEGFKKYIPRKTFEKQNEL